MIDAAILDGDWAAVRKQSNAEIVVAMIDNEVTVKTFVPGERPHFAVAPEPVYQPIPAEKAVILGKVVAVLRRLLQEMGASDPSPVSVVLLVGNQGRFGRDLPKRVRQGT